MATDYSELTESKDKEPRTARGMRTKRKLLDAALLARYEGFMRPQELRWDAWLAGQKGKVASALDMLEKEAADLDGPITIGQIAVGCALGYMDFRFADDNWRGSRPKLAKWYEGFSARPSMQATVPPQ